MITSIIVAKDKNNGIGRNNELPWHLSDDLRMFRRVTSPHAILMGRRTFDSIGRALPDRTNIVLTHNTALEVDGVHIAHSIEEAYEICAAEGIEQLFIIGGGKIFEQFLSKAEVLYLTEVDTVIEDADVFFPAVDTSEYMNIYTQNYKQSDKNDFDFKLNILLKK